jgi:propanol-preferring alcohol dehydrogenase
MKAAVVHEPGAPLSIEHLPPPEPGPGEILVRVEAAGLCHTDIHAARGDWPVKPKLPLIPGHEGVGLVEALGSGVSGLSAGDRVAVPWLGYACGRCEHCATGWETLCPRQRNTGYSVDGSYAEYVTADAGFAGRVPDGIDPFEAAPLTCAGVTTYKAVKVSGARPGDLVAVFGIGRLGHLAMQYARIAGASVAAEQAFRSLRPGGRLVLAGLPAGGQLRLPIFETVLRGITVAGSIGGTRADLAEVLRLHAEGRTHVTYARRALEQVNECFDDVLAGRTPARLVFGL